jgi:hypothetical protein
MVRHAWTPLFLAALALSAGRAATAATIPSMPLTGDVEKDLPVAPGTIIIPNNPIKGGDPHHVYQADFITQRGWLSGWNIKDLRLHYDAQSDTLLVGVNTFGIAGDADGNGVQGQADPRTLASNGVENPHLGGRESIAVRINLNDDPNNAIIAGVPGNKAAGNPTKTDNFTVARVLNPASRDLAFNFGTQLTAQTGNLLFDPSKDHPDFEFTINNFSKIPGFDIKKGYGAIAFAGSPDDVVAGEDATPYVLISPEVISTPEPATVLTWSAALAGATWFRYRRRRPAA